MENYQMSFENSFMGFEHDMNIIKDEHFKGKRKTIYTITYDEIIQLPEENITYLKDFLLAINGDPKCSGQNILVYGGQTFNDVRNVIISIFQFRDKPKKVKLMSEADKEYEFAQVLKKIDYFKKFEVFKSLSTFQNLLETIDEIDRIYFKSKYLGQRKNLNDLEKLNWVGALNQLTTLFKDLISNNNSTGKKLIENDNKELLKRVINRTFLINGKPINETSLDNYISKDDKDVRGTKRIK